MTWWQVLFFSLLEGITEFLPVSSTAHLLLVEKIWPVTDKTLFASFTIFIQLGAVLAVLLLFWQSLWRHKEIWWRLLIAVIPTAILGLIVQKLAKQYLQDASPLTGWMLIVGGVFFSALDSYWQKKRSEPAITDDSLTTTYVGEVKKTSPLKLACVGVAQAAALIPGVSRSGATLTGGRAIGLSKVSAAALAFLLALPTIAGASLLDLKDALQVDGLFYQSATQTIPLPSEEWPPGVRFDDVPTKTITITTVNWAALAMMAVGFVLSFLVALVCCRHLIKLVATKPFWHFGLWRLLIGLTWLLIWR